MAGWRNDRGGSFSSHPVSVVFWPSAWPGGAHWFRFDDAISSHFYSGARPVGGSTVWSLAPDPKRTSFPFVTNQTDRRPASWFRVLIWLRHFPFLLHSLPIMRFITTFSVSRERLNFQRHMKWTNMSLISGFPFTHLTPNWFVRIIMDIMLQWCPEKHQVVSTVRANLFSPSIWQSSRRIRKYLAILVIGKLRTPKTLRVCRWD